MSIAYVFQDEPVHHMSDAWGRGRRIQMYYDQNKKIVIWYSPQSPLPLMVIAHPKMTESLAVPPDFGKAIACGAATVEMIIDYIAEHATLEPLAALFASLKLVKV
jgi:hypothetical protein